MKPIRISLMAFITGVMGPAVARAADGVRVDIEEWNVPWEDTRPRDPFVDGKGRVWFVGQRGDYLAYLDPGTGEFKRYELDAGAGPHNLIVDQDGSVWYAGNRAAHIGKLDPQTGVIQKYPMPAPGARDPHTLVFDAKGNIWFTVQGGNFVGKLVKSTGKVDLIEVPTPQARPYGIRIDSSGRPWITLFGTNKIATVDPETMELDEIPLPREEARPRRLAITSDGAIWYVDYAQGYLGRLDPKTHEAEEWRVPGGAESRPYGMAADGQDRVWFVESGLEPNRFVGFDTKSKEFFARVEIPSGAGSVRHMYFHEPGRQVWFGTDANTIGRAELPAGE